MFEVDRTQRVAEFIKRELAHIISRELNDNRINSVTVTGVTVSRDLRYSTVFFSHVDATVPHNELEKLLNNSSKFIRRTLSKRMTTHTTPALNFKYDASIQRGVEMSQLIEKLNKDKPVGEE